MGASTATPVELARALVRVPRRLSITEPELDEPSIFQRAGVPMSDVPG